MSGAMSAAFNPLQARPPGAAQDAPPEPAAEDWRAIVAALLPVRECVERHAQRVLAQPVWMHGLKAADAAFGEGRRDAWRVILAAIERAGTEPGARGHGG